MRIKSGDFFRYLPQNSKMQHYQFVPIDLCTIMQYLNVDDKLSAMLIHAHRVLGVLEGISRYMPHMDAFENMIVLNEACKSCSIDNIIVDCEEALVAREKNSGLRSALNCYNATKEYDGQALTDELLCNLHRSVMGGITAGWPVGDFRTEPFLMHPNYSTNTEEYNPPIPEFIPSLLEDLNAFAQTTGKADVLVKAALIYYQFETIHPFQSGNGRVGRLLPIAVLMNERILSRPVLSLSDFLYQYNDECLKYFRGIQHFGEYMEWIKFFVQGVITSAENAIDQIVQAYDLRCENKQKLNSYEKAVKNLSVIYDFIEQNPVLSVKEVAKQTGISYNTAAKAVELLVKLKILYKKNEQTRYKLFCYKEYLDIFIN